MFSFLKIRGIDGAAKEYGIYLLNKRNYSHKRTNKKKQKEIKNQFLTF